MDLIHFHFCLCKLSNDSSPVWCIKHILYAHGAFYMDHYGSLDIWSTQGMEKSHYQAKGVYFKNTWHGGGATHSNYLQEMFNWFFRHTFGRTRKMEKAKKSELAKKLRMASRIAASEKWKRSQAALRHAAWRSTKVRNGSVWVSR